MQKINIEIGKNLGRFLRYLAVAITIIVIVRSCEIKYTATETPRDESNDARV